MCITLRNNSALVCCKYKLKIKEEISKSSKWANVSFPLEIPVPSLRPQTSWLDVFPTEFVKLSCGMDGTTDWTYTWYKDRQKVQADNVSFDSDAMTLSIESASASHAGRYECSGKLKSRSVYSNLSSERTLDVYGEIIFSHSSFEEYFYSVV